MKSPRHRRPTKSAFSFIEILASCFLMIVLAVFTADICLLIFACSVNDRACRDVVRAAAQQPNGSKAMQFAQASVANHATDGTFISPIILKTLVYQDYGGNPPAGQPPYVQAVTTVNVTTPTPIFFFGAAFTNHFSFSQIYTSPIVKTKYILN